MSAPRVQNLDVWILTVLFEAQKTYIFPGVPSFSEEQKTGIYLVFGKLATLELLNETRLFDCINESYMDGNLMCSFGHN